MKSTSAVGRALPVVLAAGALAAAAAGSGGAPPAAVAATEVTVVGRDFSWSPAAPSIEVGDTVTWTNEQGFHNVMVGSERLNAPGFPSDPAWNPSPRKTFTAAGSYSFVCEVHPGMAGTVTVTAPGEPTPTPTPTPQPTPEPVPPPPDDVSDSVPPELTGVTVSSAARRDAQGRRESRVRIRFTISEPATLNARLTHRSGRLRSFRAHARAGTWTIERAVDEGRHSVELWAVDATGNRSATHTMEVAIGG